MNRRLVYILVLIALGFILTATTKHWSSRLAGVALFVILQIAFRQRSLATGQVSALQKVSATIIASSVFGAIAAVLFIKFHVRYIGIPLLNFSLILNMAGCVTGLIGLTKSNNDSDVPANTKRQSFVLNAAIYLGIICSVAGMLLGINRYRGAKLLMFGGVSFAIIVPIFVIIYKKYTDEKGN